jgi:hypothetical protein
VKPLLLCLLLAALLAVPTSSEAALFRRRPRAAAAVAARRAVVARPRIVARAPARRFGRSLFTRPRVGIVRGAVRLRGC